MTTTKSYDLLYYQIVIFFNLTIAFIMLITLTHKFLSWLIKGKNIIVFLYFVSFCTACIVILSIFFIMYNELQGKPKIVTPAPNPWDKTSSKQTFFDELYRISFMICFSAVWITTSILLKSYSKIYAHKIGKRTFGILVSLPLIYFIFSLDYVVNLYHKYIFIYPYLLNLFIYLFGGTKQISGLFFALSFILMSKNTNNRDLKYYLMVSAIGIMILFSSVQISILQIIPYPPYGLSTIAILPLSSYLLFIGLYNSSLTISYDRKLLSDLSTHITNQPSVFLNKIGSIEWKKI